MASIELQKLLENIRAAGSFDGDLMTMRKMTSRAPAYPEARRTSPGSRSTRRAYQPSG